MSEEETKDPTPFMTAQGFFDMYTTGMDAESDQLPMLYYYTPAGGHICVLADTPPPEQGGMQRMLSGLLNKLVSEAGRADWIWMGSEAYGKTMPKEAGESEPDHRPGSLQEAAEAGDPTVIEIVMICGVGPDGATVMGQRQFERKDGEVVWLDELQVMDGVEVGGGIPDLFRQAVKI